MSRATLLPFLGVDVIVVPDSWPDVQFDIISGLWIHDFVTEQDSVQVVCGSKQRQRRLAHRCLREVSIMVQNFPERGTLYWLTSSWARIHPPRIRVASNVRKIHSHWRVLELRSTSSATGRQVCIRVESLEHPRYLPLVLDPV